MRNNIPPHCAVATYSSAAGAVDGVRALLVAGVDVSRLSVAAKQVGVPNETLGFYTVGKVARFWGKQADSWNRLSVELSESGLFVTPEPGPLIVMGPLVDFLMAALEGIQAPSAPGIVAAALGRIGAPVEASAQLQSLLAAGRVLVVVLGDDFLLSDVTKVLATTRPLDVASYPA
jgi:hypothetical protein